MPIPIKGGNATAGARLKFVFPFIKELLVVTEDAAAVATMDVGSGTTALTLWAIPPERAILGGRLFSLPVAALDCRGTVAPLDTASRAPPPAAALFCLQSCFDFLFFVGFNSASAELFIFSSSPELESVHACFSTTQLSESMPSLPLETLLPDFGSGSSSDGAW